jgi:hypothetical protein
MRIRVLLASVIALMLIAAGAAIAAPSPVSAPQITGTPDYNSLLTCQHGTWAGNPVTFSYVWTTDIESGALGTEQTLRVPSVIGYPVTCTVTATDASGASATASAAVTIAQGLTTVKIKHVSIKRGEITIAGQVGPSAAARSKGAKGSVALGLKQGKGSFLELSQSNGYVKPNGDFTISANQGLPTGRTRYAILFYPASNLYQQLTVQTRPERVPRA